MSTNNNQTYYPSLNENVHNINQNEQFTTFPNYQETQFIEAPLLNNQIVPNPIPNPQNQQ